MYPAISTGAFFPSSVAKTSLPLDEGQRTGHSCRLLTYRGTHTHAQREGGKEGERPGEEPKPPCAGPPAGLPERPEAGSRRAGAPRSGRAPPPAKAQRARCWHSQGGGGVPAFPSPAGSSLGRPAAAARAAGRRPPPPPHTHTPNPRPPAGSGRVGATCRAPPAAPGCPSCRGCAWPGRARAAWRGPAPRSEPPARTWRGC